MERFSVQVTKISFTVYLIPLVVFCIGLLLPFNLAEAQQAQDSSEYSWEVFVEQYVSLNQEEQARVRSTMSLDEQAYLDQLLAERLNTTSAGVPNLAVLPDPGNLTAYRDRVGQTFYFLVTGGTAGIVWGTGIYTDDSNLSTAAVHAGVLQPGVTGVVAVTILPGQASYQGSTGFGVTSSNYGSWHGSYQFEGITITAGVPTQLAYTVVVRNLSGVPVADPVIQDNGRILDNTQAVKTGGNQDHILEVGETWTWTYQETVTGAVGQTITNTATVEGPDDATLDADLTNNTAATTVPVIAPPGGYDLEISKTVAIQPTTGEEIEIGISRDAVLDECDVWQAAQSGGYLGTEDLWDISALPSGTVFDLRYNAHSVPDRYVVEYPVGTRVLDTGWRGEQSYLDRNPQLYPGGLSGPGQGQVDGVFIKGQANAFKVIVYGPEEDTAWDYEVRGNCP